MPEKNKSGKAEANHSAAPENRKNHWSYEEFKKRQREGNLREALREDREARRAERFRYERLPAAT